MQLMVSLRKLDLDSDRLTEIDDPNSNEAVRNLVLDHATSMIFQRNYLSRMIRYDTQAAYRGTASRGSLIIASHRMSRVIDPRRPRRPSPQQLADLRQDAGIQRLREYQQDLYNSIRKKYNFIYRAEGQPIYNEYQQVKREIDRLLKEKGRAFKAQMQADYDATAPTQDMLAQIAADETVLRHQSSIPLRNALVSPKPSSTRRGPPNLMGTWIGRYLSLET